jgi:hypothetical protein
VPQEFRAAERPWNISGLQFAHIWCELSALGSYADGTSKRQWAPILCCINFWLSWVLNMTYTSISLIQGQEAQWGNVMQDLAGKTAFVTGAASGHRLRA